MAMPGTMSSNRIALENRRAAELRPPDTADLFANCVLGALEGGRAAILVPERRARLLALATRLGLRPFDANLVIALAQDRVRRGEAASPLPGFAASSRPPIRTGRRARLDLRGMVSLVAGGVLGGFAAVGVINWFISGASV
jgi:hypothetical protein